MSTPDVVWGALLAAGLVYEAAALVNKKQNDTLSETTRRWFGTRTPVGRWAFGVTWIGFAVWYFWHILW